MLSIQSHINFLIIGLPEDQSATVRCNSIKTTFSPSVNADGNPKQVNPIHTELLFLKDIFLKSHSSRDSNLTFRSFSKAMFLFSVRKLGGHFQSMY